MQQTESQRLIFLGALLAVGVLWGVTANNPQAALLLLVAAGALKLFSLGDRYAFVVLTAWVMTPGLRRIVDWQLGYGSISVLSILPLLVLLLPVVLLVGRWRQVPEPLLLLAVVWSGAFVYALGIGLANGQGLAALYTFAQFCLPPAFGLWLTTVWKPDLYPRLAWWLLGLAVLASLYGFYQFVAPPPWDTQWMVNSQMTSIGKPEPFEVRVFSVLNSDGPFADFLVFTLLFNLPRFKLERPWSLGMGLLLLLALSLTLVRSAWLGLLGGIILYLVLSPNRSRMLGAATGLVTLGAVGLLLLPALPGSERSSERLTTRFQTFTNLEQDVSIQERQALILPAFERALGEPTGEGLGVIGTATKLSAEAQTTDFDNGYLGRFVEMGYPGFIAYLGVLAGSFFWVLRGRWQAGSALEAEQWAMVAAMLGALLLLELAVDHHEAFMGIYFWMGLGLVAGFARRGTTDGQ
ncbi:O-antigen ligase family protein [Anthocerotibacter panamensis]|uniref:O-antigen ligase family protein n=1 Tax=Anthocerotibacter panamensis TaxID=2857077 RepID=UPI001C401B33|nr:O-antigen ligase family protein [Anthocerotibacter panamensis]